MKVLMEQRPVLLVSSPCFDAVAELRETCP